MPNSLSISFNCSECTVNTQKTKTQTPCSPKEEASQTSGRGSRWRVTPRLMCVKDGTAHGERVIESHSIMLGSQRFDLTGIFGCWIGFKHGGKT